MSIFSRRKRLSNRTPRTPKMSSRRQFHRALRRHPAWPAVMEQAAVRARAQESVKRDRDGVMAMGTVSHSRRLRRIFNRNRINVIAMGQTSKRARVRRNFRRNRAVVAALIAVSALVALLTGLAMASGGWVSGEVNIFPDGFPPLAARFGAATTFDANNAETFIFGGFTAAPGGTPVASNDSWGHRSIGTWGSNSTWFSRNSVHRPSPRGYASMVYDGARRNVVLFGGAPYRSNDVFDETWIWNGSDWTLADPPEPRPLARQNASMVYDAHRKLVVMFGGRGAGGLPVEDEGVWTWNGAVWKKLKPPGDSPLARHSAAMAYDLCRGEAILFGGNRFFRDGITGGDSSLKIDSLAQETWTWNGTRWTKEAPVRMALEQPTPLPGSPPGRIGASMTYSKDSGRVLLYGGFTTTDNNQSPVAADNDVWIWNGDKKGWEKHASETSSGASSGTVLAPIGPYLTGLQPPPRAYASFEFYPEGNIVHIFGGTPADPTGLLLGNPTALLLGSSSAHPVPQVALGDRWYFNENVATEEDELRRSGLKADGCHNPVPIPPDGAPTGGQVQQAPRKLETRDEIKEIAQLPALLGTSPNRTPPGVIQATTAQPPCARALPEEDKEYVKNTHLATDSKRNRVYQFFMCQNGNRQRPGNGTGHPSIGAGTRKVLIQAYDAKTLRPLGSVLVPMPTLTQDIDFSSKSGSSVLHDVDRGQFIILGDKLYLVQQHLIENGARPDNAVLLGEGDVRKITRPAGATASFFNHPKTGRAKLLLSGSGIAQFDLLDERQDWSTTLADCSSQPNGGMRTADRVYTSCITTTGSKWGVVRIPIEEDPNDTVANDREKVGSAAPEVFAASIYSSTPELARTWGDPKAERVLLQVTSNYSSTLWVFDGKVSRYVGRVGLADMVNPSFWGSAFDQETGRLYMLAPNQKTSTYGGAVKAEAVQGGMMVVDTRLTPVPQVANFGQFAYLSEPAQIGVLAPGAGLSRRLFVRRAVGNTPSQYPGHPDYQAQSQQSSNGTVAYPDGERTSVPDEMHYLVLSEELPVPEQPELGQLDALTVPVAESTGKTDVSFDAEASAYGIRLRSLGGIMAVLRPPAQANGDINQPPPLICLGPDRELVAGWVANAHLTDLETSARSSGLEVDSSSKVDLEGPISRCQAPAVGASTFGPTGGSVYNALWPLVPVAQTDRAIGSGILSLEKDPKQDDLQFNTGNGLAWDKHFTEVECAGDDVKTNQATLTVVDVYGSATCDQKQARVVGTARGNFGPTPANAVYSVGEGYSKVVVAREAVRGVVVTATAEATGIKLPGVISIGYVKTEAVSWSNGRPFDGARASFTRKICNVNPPLPVNPANSDPRPANSDPSAPNTGCLNDAQQAKMAKDFNARMGVNGKMLLPTPQPDLLRGSPGGYIAGVTKLLAEELEGQFFTRDSQKEVPGLVIEFYKDSATQGFGRQVLELAGVRGVTGLGVQCGSDFVYSFSAKDCVALTFEDDPVVEFEDEEEELSSTDDDTEFETEGGWIPVEAAGAPEGLALGKRLGRFIENLPIVRLLPIRQMGEALLAASVWLLLGLPLLFAGRRLTINLGRNN